MKIQATGLPGLLVLETPVFRDSRGGFQRLHCEQTFADSGLPIQFVQTNLTTNSEANILRGLHYQRTPYREDKLIRCVHGAILDVVIDIRRSSLTFGRHFAIELTAGNGLALLVPKGFAHGYLTITAGATVLYQVSTPYTPSAENGIRWNDPFLGFSWPHPRPIVSDKDSAWPDFSREPGESE